MLMLSVPGFALVLLVPTIVHGLAKLEPPNGKLIFGPWFDSSTGPVSSGETAAGWNRKIGYNSGVFQAYQHMPLRTPFNGPPDYDTSNHNADGTLNINIFNDGTDAAIFFTIYPDNSTGILDSDITALANQCAEIIAVTGRKMYLRFAPEMNGGWMGYSGNPAAFISLWRKVYTAINAVAPSIAMVWSPNPDVQSGLYPYAPYWPGPEYVDWVGLSIYWKGLQDNYPISYISNTLCPSDFTAQVMDAQGPQGGKISFYQTYAVAFDKPFVISEGGGAFQTHNSRNGVTSLTDPGPGRVATVMGYWYSNIFNPAFMARYPRFKMILAFEIWKRENEDVYTSDRDFRITADEPTIAAFRAELQKLDAAGTMLWASPAKPSPSPSPPATTTTRSSTTSKAPAVNTVTSAVVSPQQPSQNPAKDANHTSSSRSISPFSPVLMLSVLMTVMFFF
ncbi:glycoside hydrolase superfamily [Obelidium mucronatum]|nr:glycoside hydrolase superfamily [Obelidium mucronatum]